MAGGNAMADDWAVSGFVRQEIAAKTTSDQNANNQQGNLYNGVATSSSGLLGADATRPASLTQKNNLNMFQTRIEVNLDGKLNDEWSAHFKLRGIADEIGKVEKSFKNLNLFKQEFHDNGQANPLEAAGKNWMLDLPLAYLDYSKGPLWVRMGNQQIAWGEALFFRIADLPNGIDLRRHSALGVAAEEYSDTRVPALGIRASYRLNESWDVEGFAQQFQPTVLPPPNSPYNVIASAFNVHEQEGYAAARNNINIGLRLKGSVNGYGLQAFAVKRTNPDGVFKWTQAAGSSGQNIPGTAFTASSGTGVYSGQEWLRYASSQRLDGIGALLTSLNEFPIGAAVGGLASLCGATGNGTSSPISANSAAAKCLLDTFFSPDVANGGLGNLRGNIRRDFLKENVVGFSVNHVFEGEPDTLLDQLIGRFELSYTPNKRFTNPTLSQSYIEKNETQFAFIAEKYHKFSSDFPATYMVAQWLHKSASDLFGRSLSGLDNTPGHVPQGQKHGFNAVAFAVQQPSPTLAWRYDFTALTDLKGGWLLQPGVKWKPSRNLQVDVYANIIKSYGEQNYRNFAQGLEYANELFIRGSYSF